MTDRNHARRRKPLHPKKRLTLSPVHSDDTISKDSHLADTVQFCEPNSDDSFSIASLDSLVTDEIGKNSKTWTASNSHPPQTFRSRKRRRKSPSINNSHSCTLCGRHFTEARSVRRHMMAVHNGEKPFSCEICGKLFAELGNLKKHQSAVHEGRKPFLCPICSRGFSQFAHMRSHSVTVHKTSFSPATTTANRRTTTKI
ncbi:hypothetical protein FBUS_00670 [Fasciolopsis buskii]|uniref:C2H2-type domain-containing protein n=1 Tax=Fasciolopsis buskii TaxID=27845 RepID=A0A8E0RQL2_9TREM|nr:hypothetical protein FBUS_00670 [Fasciolopsis buski]